MLKQFSVHQIQTKKNARLENTDKINLKLHFSKFHVRKYLNTIYTYYSTATDCNTKFSI